MDTANLEAAARRYRDTEAALDTARTNLQAEAVTFLQQHDERGSQAAAARITGWSREHIRNLWKKAEEEAERSRRDAEVEALRRKVDELSATKKPSPAVATPRQQVTQAIPEPPDLTGIFPEVAALPYGRIKELAETAEARQPKWVEEVRRDYPDADERRLHYLIVNVGMLCGRTPPELTAELRPRLGGDNPLTAEEVAEFAARARSLADETQTKKIDQEAGKAPDGKKDLAAMHAALDMELLSHDEVYGERPVSSEEQGG